MGALRPVAAPAIVHCSAGVGRTGALILMDHALALLRHAQPVYPLDIVRCLREQRPLCVQNAVSMNLFILPCANIYLLLFFSCFVNRINTSLCANVSGVQLKLWDCCLQNLRRLHLLTINFCIFYTYISMH